MEEYEREQKTILERAKKLSREILGYDMKTEHVFFPKTWEEFDKIRDMAGMSPETRAFYDRKTGKIYIDPEYIWTILEAERKQKEIGVNTFYDPEEHRAELISLILHEHTHKIDHEVIQPDYRQEENWNDMYDERTIVGEAKAHMIEMLSAKKMHKYAAKSKFWNLEAYKSSVVYDKYMLGKAVGYLLGHAINPTDEGDLEVVRKLINAKTHREFIAAALPILKRAERDEKLSEKMREIAKSARRYLEIVYADRTANA